MPIAAHARFRYGVTRERREEFTEMLLAFERMTLTVAEAAQLLGISRTLAYERARAGELPGLIHIGRSYRASKPALLRWLGAEPGSPAPGNDRPGDRPPATTPDEV